MTRYLIDIRLMGPVKRQIEDLAGTLQEQFPVEKNLTVPHITLVGPFSTDDEEQLIQDFTRVCRNCPGIPAYDTGGVGFFDATRVVYVTITPDDILRQFRYALAQAVAPYCTLRDYDHEGPGTFRFHATLAMKLDWLTFMRIRWYFRNQEPVVYHHHPIRATLLADGAILCEYDFLQERMLTRAQARGRATFLRDTETMKLWDDGEGEGEQE